MDVVIAGAGLAGMETALRLQKKVPNQAMITVIDQYPLYLHPDQLPQVFTGKQGVNRDFLLSERSISFKHGAVEDFSLDEKEVAYDGGSKRYDFLVLALGSRPKTPPGAALLYRGVDDARRVKKEIEGVLRKGSELRGDERAQALTIVVGGAGPAGVQLMAAIERFIHDECGEYGVRPIEVKLVLAEREHRLLPEFPAEASDYVETYLSRNGVDVKTSAKVRDVGEGYVTINEERVPSETFIWCGGCRSNDFLAGHEMHTDEDKRVIVNPYMQTVTDARVYGVGDFATFRDVNYKGPRTTSPRNIEEQAEVVATNIAATIEGGAKEMFEYDKPSMYLDLSRESLVWYKNSFKTGIIASLMQKYRDWTLNRQYST